VPELEQRRQRRQRRDRRQRRERWWGEAPNLVGRGSGIAEKGTRRQIMLRRYIGNNT
jgi:hypothetical protein